MNLGRARKIQSESELFSHVRRSVLQSRERRFVLLFISGNSNVNPRGSLVSRQSHVGNRDRCQSRIFQLVTNNLSNLFFESVSSSFTTVHCPLQLCRRYSLDYVRLDLITDFHVVEILQTDTALEAFAYFRNVILEPA